MSFAITGTGSELCSLRRKFGRPFCRWKDWGWKITTVTHTHPSCSLFSRIVVRVPCFWTSHHCENKLRMGASGSTLIIQEEGASHVPRKDPSGQQGWFDLTYQQLMSHPGWVPSAGSLGGTVDCPLLAGSQVAPAGSRTSAVAFDQQGQGQPCWLWSESFLSNN